MIMSQEANSRRIGFSTECPNCGHRIDRELEIIEHRAEPISAVDTYLNSIGPELKQVALVARKEGLIAVFEKVWLEANGTSAKPRIFERALISWLTVAKPAQQLPDHVRLFYMSEFKSDAVEVLVANRIAAVVVAGVVRQFIPEVLLRRDLAVDSGKIRIGDMIKLQSGMANWAKTKRGYVPEGSKFAEALRVRSVGEFARLGL